MSNLKNVWTVKEPGGTQRKSESMITNTVTLVLSILAAVVAKNYDFEIGDADIAILAAAITAGLGSVAGLVLRWRSQGGIIVAKDLPQVIKPEDWGV